MLSTQVNHFSELPMLPTQHVDISRDSGRDLWILLSMIMCFTLPLVWCTSLSRPSPALSTISIPYTWHTSSHNRSQKQNSAILHSSYNLTCLFRSPSTAFSPAFPEQEPWREICGSKARSSLWWYASQPHWDQWWSGGKRDYGCKPGNGIFVWSGV